jgi:hypothetical protein
MPVIAVRVEVPAAIATSRMSLVIF